MRDVYSPAVIRALTRPLTELGLDHALRLWATRHEAEDIAAAWRALPLAAHADDESFTTVVADPPPLQITREGRIYYLAQALGPGRTRAAEQRGAAMSLDTAAEYALILADPDSVQAPVPGKLSARERELVALVARGRTDAQIAAELYISIRTVRSHLDRIRDKTGCRRRADLTRLALSTGLV